MWDLRLKIKLAAIIIVMPHMITDWKLFTYLILVSSSASSVYCAINILTSNSSVYRSIYDVFKLDDTYALKTLALTLSVCKFLDPLLPV